MSYRKKDQPYTSQLRGVAALLETTSTQEAAESLSLSAIMRATEQPRYYFDPEKQKQLERSIKKHGILEPLLVRPIASGQYELVAGERRYLAALAIGLTEVPVVIKELSSEEAWQIALVENLQRVDLNPVEETEGILKLLSLELNQDVEDVVLFLYRMQNEAKGKVTQNVLGNEPANKIIDLFDSLGNLNWESFVSSRLPLRKLPEDILNAIRRGEIAYTKAQAIARLKEPELRSVLLGEAISNNLSLSEIKARIKAHRHKPETSELKEQLKAASRRLYTSKCWNNPKKQKKLQKLLSQIEALLADES